MMMVGVLVVSVLLKNPPLSTFEKGESLSAIYELRNGAKLLSPVKGRHRGVLLSLDVMLGALVVSVLRLNPPLTPFKKGGVFLAFQKPDYIIKYNNNNYLKFIIGLHFYTRNVFSLVISNMIKGI